MPRAWSFANSAAIVCPTICAFGAIVYAIGTTIPVYTDYEAAVRLKLDACVSGKTIDGWFERIAALETIRHPLMQGGVSIILATLTWFGLLRVFRGRSRFLPRSPGNLPAFFALGLVVLGSSWLAYSYSYYLDLARGEFPWCADSIGIPLNALSLSYPVQSVIALVAGAAISIRFGRLPVELTQWDAKKPMKSRVVTLLLAVPFALIFVATLVNATTSSLLTVPAGVIALFLVAATRAALLSDKSAKVN